MLTTIDVTALQEALLVVTLRGDAQLINLSELSSMTSEERRTNELLGDLGTLFTDPKTFKVVDGLDELPKFGNRVHWTLEGENFLALKTWRPDLEDIFAGTVKYEYPSRYAALTLGFQKEEQYGWKWNTSPELLIEDQAITSSLVSLTLDGLTWKLYGEPQEKLPTNKLGMVILELLREEVLLFLEARQLEGLALGKQDDKNNPKESDVTEKKVRFLICNGVTVSESLAFGLQRIIGTGHLLTRTHKVMQPRRHFIQDWVEWEESLEMLHIVPAMPLVWEEFEYPKAGRPCIKKYDKASIRYDYNYNSGPYLQDRGRIRFPNLNTTKRVSKSRMASPPPRPDDPDGLRDENRRRRQGKVHHGPPCKPGLPEDKDFVRDLEWERTLPDDNVRPLGNASGSQGKRRSGSPNNNGKQSKRPCLSTIDQEGPSHDQQAIRQYQQEQNPYCGNPWRGGNASTRNGRPYHHRGRFNWVRGGRNGDGHQRGNGHYRPRKPGRRGWRASQW